MKVRLLVLSLLFAAWFGEAVEFPPDGFLPGWTKSGTMQTFAPHALFNHINGGAELFLELGFCELQVQKYTNRGDEIAVEAYRMDSPAAALAIYLLKAAPETPLPGIAPRHSGDRYQIALLKSNYFVFINNFNGRTELLPAMTALAKELAATIPSGEPPDLPDILPVADRVPGTFRLLRGPYSLQSVYTLGEGDVLMLDGTRFAASAAYGEAGDPHHVRIVVAYEDETIARRAFENLRRHLDPYYKVLEEGSDFFVFRDFQDRFGLAEVSDRQIKIRVKMKLVPVRSLW